MGSLIKIDISDRDPLLIEKVRMIIKGGGIVALPTDTFYGLGVDPFNPTAIEKIYQIKGRDPKKPILILIEDIRRLNLLAEEITKDAEVLINHLWPGPLTIIFKASPRLPPILTGETGKIGVRLPASGFLIWLLEGLNIPLTATSANPSGLPAPATAQEVERYFGGNLDLIIDTGRADGIKESTVIDATETPIRLIREGMVKLDKIEGLVGKINHPSLSPKGRGER